jgi:aspartyl-tRNA(Asn)/glutamyl-tRNA(Gln) amidotransferase subunit C
MLVSDAPGNLAPAPEENIFVGRDTTAGDNYIMALDKATVAHIATLARIKLPEGEEGKIAGELSHILTWIEQLAEVDTSGVAPMTSVAEMRLRMRADVVSDGDRQDDILANAPARARGFFAVPKVVE